MNPGTLETFSAVTVVAGQIRRLWFQAAGEEEARQLCVTWNAGYEGPARGPEFHTTPAPEAYDEKTARALLGGVSKMTLWRWVAVGKLDRVPGTRRFLVTRSSIERLTGQRRS